MRAITFHASEWLRSKRRELKVLLRMWTDGSLVRSRWEGVRVQPRWKVGCSFLKQVKVERPYDPAIPLLGIYLNRNTTLNGYMYPMCPAALFTTAKGGGQPKCPSTDERIKYIHTHTQTHENTTQSQKSRKSCHL